MYFIMFRGSMLLSHFSRVRLHVTLWTAAHQALLSTRFSRQEYWSGLPFPSPAHCPKDMATFSRMRESHLVSNLVGMPLSLGMQN